MQLRRFDSPQAFYDHALPFLVAQEAENNLPLGIIGAIIQDPQRYGTESPYMALVEGDGAVLLVAVRTPPHPLVVSWADRLDTVDLVVQDTHEKYGDALPGVNGPSAVSKAFAEKWHARTGRAYRRGMSLRIFRLDKVNPVAGAPGQFRRATDGDRLLLAEWIRAFNEEALSQEMAADQVERTLNRLLDSNDAGLYVWENGPVVSVAAHSRPTPNGVSISLVYTPLAHRRRGYASACVATLSQRLLDCGRKFCFLYTDLSNPTSNHIYQEIGYRAVCDADEYLFSISDVD